MMDPTLEKNTRQNRVKEALGRLYDHHPPYFREYLRRYEEDPTSRVFAPLAEAYRRMGQPEEAIKICQDGLEHHPDFHGGRVTLAKCYMDKRRFDAAQAELERVVQFVPENLLAQRLLGDVYLALKEKKSALHCYKMALLLSPADVTLAERVHKLEKDSQSEEPDSELVEAVLASPLDADLANPMTADVSDTRESDYQVIDRVTLDAGEDLPPLWDVPQDGPVISKAPLPTEGVDVETLLGSLESETDDAFKVEHVSHLFSEESSPQKQEITTETLGDLYFKQGQSDKALRIFEKLADKNPSQELMRKINQCRGRLGVDREAMVRARKIAVLRGILKSLHA